MRAAGNLKPAACATARGFVALLYILLCLQAGAQQNRVLEDVYFDKTALRFGNAFFSIGLDKKTGNLQQLQAGGTSLIQSGETPAVDVEVDGIKQMQRPNLKLLRYATRNENGRAVLVVHQQGAGSTDTVQTTYIIYPGKARLERAVSVFSATDGLRKFGGFYFNLPGMHLGNAATCVANVPGPFWPATFTPPNTPYDSLVHKTTRYHSAPDGGFGIFSLSNTAPRQTATVFMKTSGDAGTATAVYGNGRTFNLEQKNNKAMYLQKGTVARSDTQCILLTQTFEEALALYRHMAAQRMPLAKSTPAWVKEAVILEILPTYFKGGFTEIAQKLPFYKKIGFNTIYLMPHWKGGYSPIDLYQVDSAYGTKEDLHQLVQTAHGLGMRVLFDMVIHGFNTASPIIQEHPEFFYRTAQDSLMIHPAWGSVMTDFMNQAYQQYMKEYVLYEQRTFGHDGYRVDAASYKGPNWKRNVAYPAYRSGAAAPLLMQAMLDALRTNNRETTLLSEVFGPVFYTVSNFAHDNQTEAMSFVIKQIEKGTYTLAQYKKHLQYVYACLPEGAVRVFYTRNHDTSWFYEFFGYTPLFLTLEAIHAFFGVPEIFAGDAGYKFNPNDDAATYAFYEKLFAARRQYPEFTTGRKNFNAVSSNDPHVFAAAAEDGKHRSVFVASAVAQAKNVAFTLAAPLAAKNVATAWDIIQQKKVPVTKTKTGFSLSLQPFQLVVVRLR